MSIKQDATPWWIRSHDWFTRALPYVLVVMFAIFGSFGFITSVNQISATSIETRQEAQERVLFEQCRSDNDTRVLVAEVLDEISVPQRPDETDAFYEARLESLERAKGLLRLNECPEKPADIDMP